MRRPSAAFTLSFLALLLALGGPAIAGKLITSRDVKDRSLSGQDLRSNTITGRVVKNLSGRDVLTDSLDGTDIAEETLGSVPRARSATQAERADTAERAERAERAGVAETVSAIQRVHFAKPAGGEGAVLELGGLTLSGRCSSSGALTVTATSGSGVAWVRVSGSSQRSAEQTDPVFARDDEFRPGEEFNVLPNGADNVAGDLVYVGADGGTVTVTFLAEQGIAAGRGIACLFAGTAVRGGP